MNDNEKVAMFVDCNLMNNEGLNLKLISAWNQDETSRSIFKPQTLA